MDMVITRIADKGITFMVITDKVIADKVIADMVIAEAHLAAVEGVNQVQIRCKSGANHVQIRCKRTWPQLAAETPPMATHGRSAECRCKSGVNQV